MPFTVLWALVWDYVQIGGPTKLTFSQISFLFWTDIVYIHFICSWIIRTAAVSPNIHKWQHTIMTGRSVKLQRPRVPPGRPHEDQNRDRCWVNSQENNTGCVRRPLLSTTKRYRYTYIHTYTTTVLSGPHLEPTTRSPLIGLGRWRCLSSMGIRPQLSSVGLVSVTSMCEEWRYICTHNETWTTSADFHRCSTCSHLRRIKWISETNCVDFCFCFLHVLSG